MNRNQTISLVVGSLVAAGLILSFVPGQAGAADFTPPTRLESSTIATSATVRVAADGGCELLVNDPTTADTEGWTVNCADRADWLPFPGARCNQLKLGILQAAKRACRMTDAGL